MAIDFYKTLGQHAYCSNTPAAHVFENAQNVAGFVAVFVFCNRDLWSWIVAILQDSMPSVLIHLLHTLNISFFFWVIADAFLNNAISSTQVSQEL